MRSTESPVGFTPSPALYPFTPQWFESSAGRVHYIDEGRGRPILFLHGNPTWSFLYRKIVSRLHDQFRCVAVDYPGFGLSVRPDGYGYTAAEHAAVVGELVDHLGLDGFIVMGQDWGGPIGLAVAAERADRVHGLVMGNTFAGPVNLAGKIFGTVMSSPPLQWWITRRNFFVKRMMPLGMTTKLTDEEKRHYQAVQTTPASRKGVAVFPRQIRAAGPWLAALERRVGQTLADKPLLIVWGMRDPAFRPAYISRWQQAFADHTLVELPDAKHYIQEDAPDEIAAAIVARFGASADPSSGQSSG